MGEFPWIRRAARAESAPAAGRAKGAVALAEELGLRAEQLHSLAALFPGTGFEVAGAASLPARADAEVIVVPARAADAAALAAGLPALAGGGRRVVVVLDAPNLGATRALMAKGAADVLYAPLTEAALALSLERIFASRAQASGPRRAGEVVALLKAGGGVGATSLGVQVASLLSARGDRVCFADLDIQWGAAALYLDLPDALSVTDCLSAGASLAETEFISRLAVHASGVRLLAAPNDVAPLEMIQERHVDPLLRTLRQEMDLTICDLPADWTAWTNHVLHTADRIVLVTRLTVGNLQLAKRQLRMLSSQQLEAKPLTLVCNAVSGEQQEALQPKAAERALGRAFDLMIPDEARLMREATNQGVELRTLPRSGKLLKAVTALADAVSAKASARPTTR